MKRPAIMNRKIKQIIALNIIACIIIYKKGQKESKKDPTKMNMQNIKLK